MICSDSGDCDSETRQGDAVCEAALYQPKSIREVEKRSKRRHSAHNHHLERQAIAQETGGVLDAICAVEV
jgi:hypothetical protein